MITVNALGDTCPIPVVKTKNAIRDMNGAAGQVETLVDNEIAVQNLTKMANQKGYKVASEKLEAQKFRVVMEIPAGTVQESASVETEVCAPNAVRNTVVVISSATMGSGNDELGAALMKAFIYALSQQDALPKTILFYNGGVKNTTEGSPSIDDLKSMEAQGVQILSCGTCLNYYGLADQLKVGGVTNMYDIVEKQMQATSIVKP